MKGFAFTTFTITALTVIMLAMLATIQITENPRISSDTQQINNQKIITQQINNNYQDLQDTSLRKIMLHLNQTEYPNQKLNETYQGGLNNSEEQELTNHLRDADGATGPDTTYTIKHPDGFEQHINTTIQKTSQTYNTSVQLQGSYPQYQLDDTSEPDQLITTTKITTTTQGQALNTQINTTDEITTETKIPH